MKECLFVSSNKQHRSAQMVELVDALVSDASDRKILRVRVPLWHHTQLIDI